MAKKRKISPLLVLFLLLLVCVGVLFGVRAYNAAQEKKAAQAEQDAKIVVIPEGEYTAVSVQNETDSYELRYADERWTLADDAEFPLDQAKVKLIREEASGLTALRRITEGDTLAAYGLDKPSATLTLSDGTNSYTIALSGAVNSHYYLQLTGDEAVYEVEGSLIANAALGRLGLISSDLLPTLTADNITGFSLSSGGTVLTLEREKTDDADVWYLVENGARTEASNDALASPLSSLTMLTINGCAAYRPDADTVSALGLAAPRTLTVSYSGSDNEAHTLVLEIGEKAADGTNYCVRQQGGDYVNLLSVQTLDTVLSLSADALRK